jgi:dTMP kinase
LDRQALTGRFIVIEGIDQSGKETQSRLLVRRLRWDGHKIEKLSYPIYTSFSGREIAAFLDGKRSYSHQVLHMLYSMNRWESLDKLRELLRDSDYLIVDRYYPSNLAYGIAGGLDEQWLLSLDQGLPEPDKIILVDTSVEASFARKTLDRDVHERDKTFLKSVRKAYLNLAKRRKWIVVDGDRSVAEVNEDLWKALKSRGQRSAPRS